MINPIGPVAALAAFFSIWFGHVAVRKLEFISPSLWLPATAFLAAGLVFAAFSLFTSSFLLSTTCAILGVTLLFDAFELTRQQKRILKGHAPANPNNPRHVRLMHQYASVTTVDVLEREPTGKRTSDDGPQTTGDRPLTTDH